MPKTKSKTCSGCQSSVSFIARKRPEFCPHCGDKYWDKPKDERDLFIIQDKFIDHGRDPDVLGEMYPKLLRYAENLIKHKMKHRKNIDALMMEEKSNDIALMVIEKFLKSEDMLIKHSFGGLMTWIANGVLFGGRKEDWIDSLNEHIDNNSVELQDSLSVASSDKMRSSSVSNPEDFIAVASPTDVVNELMTMINFISRDVYCDDSKGSIYFLLGLLHSYDNKPESFKRSFKNLSSNRVQLNVDKAFFVTKKYLDGELRMDKTYFDQPIDVFEDQLKSLFKDAGTQEVPTIIKAISLLLRMPESNEDMYDLYSLMGLENFVRVLTLFEGKKVIFPPKEEVKDMIVTALLYYYREIEHMEWKEIKKIVPFEFSSISYAIKIRNLNQFMESQLKEILSEAVVNE